MEFEVKNVKCIEEKRRYFRLRLLHEMVTKTLSDQSERSKCATNDEESPKYDLKHMIAMNLASITIQDNPVLNNCFGNTRYFDNLVKYVRKEINEAIDMKAVENNLKDFCVRILKYYGQPFDINNVSREIAKLQITISHTKQNNELFSIIKKARNQQQYEILRYYFHIYFSCISLALKILNGFQDLAEIDYTPVHQILSLQAILIKTDILRLEVLCDTYDKPTIRALKIIKHKLEMTKRELDNLLTEKQMALQSYAMAADSSFDGIVEEYKNVMTTIRAEKWAIEEINKSATNTPEKKLPTKVDKSHFNQDKKCAVEGDKSNSAKSKNANQLFSRKGKSSTTSQKEKLSSKLHGSTSSKNEKQLPEGTKNFTTTGTQYELFSIEEENESSLPSQSFSHNSST